MNYKHIASVKIRRVKKFDIPAISELFDKLSDKDLEFTALCFDKKKAFVLDYLAKGQGWVAEAEGMILGVLAYETYPGSEYVMLDELVIDEDHRGMGIGRGLIRRFHSLFYKTLGITHKDNKRMINILKRYRYEKLLENPYQGTITWIRIGDD